LKQQIKEEAAKFDVRILAEQLLSEGYTLERPEELNEAAILRWQQGGR
jgi:hypothetical protein